MNLSAIYCRVSTDDQESHGSSLPYQVETCLKYAQENELTLGKKTSGERAIFQEQFSGAYYDRPQLLELLSLVKTGKISTVIFTKRDRVARDQYVFQRIKKEIEEAGGKMIFAEEKLTGDTAIDSFMGSTIVGFAEWEREQIKRRTHAGKVQHARENKWSFAFVPYGYTKNPTTKQLEIFEDEARIVRLIYRLYLEEGHTLDGIARYLDNEKIPPPSLSTKGTNNQKSIANSRKNISWKWIASTIYRIFERGELYSGTYTAFRDIYKTVAGKTQKIGEREKDLWVIIQVPPLVSVSEAEEVLERLEQNRRFAKKRSVRSYLLRGKLLCDCESPYHNMVGYPWQKVKKGKDGKALVDTEGNKIKDYYTNYRCSLFSIGKTDESRRCSNHISGIKIESLVIDTIKELFLSPESMFEYAIEREQGNGGKTWENAWEGQIEWDYTELVEKLRNLMKKHERIEELFVDGTISKERMKEMKEHVGNEQARLAKILEKEEQILRQEAFSTSARESWETIRKELWAQIGRFFLEATEEELRSLIELLVDRVMITHGEKKHVVIRFKIPLDIQLEEKYMEDAELFADDEHGKETSIGTYNFPTIFPLGEIHTPIVSKELQFEESEQKKEEENKKRSKNDKWGKWGGTWGNSISSAISKTLGYLKKKYTLNCRLDHLIQTISIRISILIFIRMFR